MPLSGGGGGVIDSMEEEDILVLKLNHTGKREESIRNSVRAYGDCNRHSQKRRKRPREPTTGGGRKRDAGEERKRCEMSETHHFFASALFFVSNLSEVSLLCRVSDASNQMF